MSRGVRDSTAGKEGINVSLNQVINGSIRPSHWRYPAHVDTRVYAEVGGIKGNESSGWMN